MTTKADQPPPEPAVQYLPHILRRIRAGEIKVPAFQRGFVWEEKQILELLESVYRGFPIGSLLLWKVEQEVLKIGSPGETLLPDVDPKYPLYYVLDGMQRLATLFSVLSYSGARDRRDKFHVIFDLESNRFQHYDGRELPNFYVRLSDLFAPRRLLQTQSFMARQERGEELIEKTIALHSIFQGDCSRGWPGSEAA